MSVKADGTLLIETGIDLSGFQGDCQKLQQAAKRAAQSISDIGDNLESIMRQLASFALEADSNADTARQKAKGAGKEAKSAAKSAKEASREAKKAQKELQKLQEQEITISRWDDTPPDYGDDPVREMDVKNPSLYGYSPEIMKSIGVEAKEAKAHVNQLLAEITRTKEMLKSMEKEGKWFGDEDYDDVYSDLKVLNQEVKKYQEQLNIAADINPFDMESFAGKIREAEQELVRLASAGQGLGNKDFDEAYRKLVLLKEEAKEYAKTLKQTAVTGDISNSGNIGKSEKKIRDYGGAVEEAKKKTKVFEKVLGSVANRIKKLSGMISAAMGKLARGAGNGMKAMAGLNRHTNKTRMSMAKMLGTSILFSTVFRAISAVTSGIGEGFQNLAMYCDTTNNSISALMSAMTQLKNSFATAFSPILTVVSPILVTFINLIARALTYVGMFFAALTGQSSFVKAIGVQQDYRDSLSGTAGAADDAADATGNLADATEKAEKANESYLSGLDEVHRWETRETSSNTGSGGGGSTGPSGSGGISPGEMFETVPIENSIKGLADKIKQLIQAEDWEGLGEFIAAGINNGLQKIYNVISWDNVGPKITAFINAFTTTFNSLVKYLDFELMGRTIGAGINTLVNTFNLLIGPGGIDFKQIGSKLSQGLRGAIGEIGWEELGNLLGNYFMISWNILNGFVSDMSRRSGAGLTGWEELGQALGRAVNGAFARIDFTQVGITLTNGINGAFASLRAFAKTTDWDGIADNVSNGLNAAFYNLNWAEAGQSLNIFLGNLAGFIVDVLDSTDWEAVGQGIGEFLGEVDWPTHLWSMITAIVDAIGDLFDGLEESGTAGKIAAFIGKAFIAVKIADITGIGTLVKKLVSKIGANLISSSSISLVAGKLKNLFGSGTKDAGDLLGNLGKAAGGASGGFSSLATSIAPLVGTAGLIVGIGAAFVVAMKGLAGWIETLQGGNGVFSEAGTAIKGFITALSESRLITDKQAEELFLLSEEMESAGIAAEERYANIAAKLDEYGISADGAERAIARMNESQTVTSDGLKGLAEATKGLSAETSNMATQIDLGAQKAEECYADLDYAVGNLTNQMHLNLDEQGKLKRALDETVDSGGTAQDAYVRLMDAVEDMGYSTETASKIIAEVFPEATIAVKESVDTHVVAAKETLESNAESMEATVDSATSNMKTDAENNLYGVQAAAEDSASGANEATVLSWGNSAREVTLKVREMKLAASTELSNMTETVRSYSESMYNIMTKKWEYVASRIGTIISDMNSMDVEPKLNSTVNIIDDCWQRAANHTVQIWDQISWTISDSIANIGNNIRRQMNSVISTVNYGISNINFSISGIESAMNFGPWKIPTVNGYRTIGFHASFPRVSKVPYLASGAVIPPRSEFLAVLGDQKHGNNIEAPESLLRKIVREESGGKQAGGTYRFVAQMNRRTFFDEMIEEAKVRRDLNGANPFSLT